MNPTTAPPVESRAARMIREIFESGRPLTYIRSSEEQRVAGCCARWAADGRLHAHAGLDLEPHGGDAPAMAKRAEAGTQAPREALDFIAAHQGAAIFHLKDFHEPLRESAEIRRRLRDVYESCLGQRKFVVITSPVRFIPEELERSIVFLELRPPDLVELAAVPAGGGAANLAARRSASERRVCTSWRARCRD